MWPQTVKAMRAWLAQRKTPVEDKYTGLMFVTTFGGSWHRDNDRSSPISAEFRKLLNSQKLYRPGLSFYALRHTFQTIADDAGDYLATRRIMGHADNSTSDHYRERFDDAKLIRVSEHVRGWLFGAVVAGSGSTGEVG